MPPDGVVMFKAVDLLKSAGSPTSGDPGLFGMGVPPAISATISIDDAPFLDVAAEFKTEVPAFQWKAEWPALRRRLRVLHSTSLIGFWAILGRATVTRDGNVVRMHLPVTRTETIWLLGLALQMLASRGS